LSTIVRADQVIVMDHGRIIERGTHAELLEAKGHYYHLYTTQLQGRVDN
jgi:ATP-binding cassette subfamily B protein